TFDREQPVEAGVPIRFGYPISAAPYARTLFLSGGYLVPPACADKNNKTPNHFMGSFLFLLFDGTVLVCSRLDFSSCFIHFHVRCLHDFVAIVRPANTARPDRPTLQFCFEKR